MRQREGRTRLSRLRQEGCLKLRFPKVGAGPAQAVLVNTAGGLAGGDRLDQSFAVEEAGHLCVTTQAAERVYRSLGAAATVRTGVSVAAGAGFSWLPQETILFDGGRLSRRLDVDAEAGSRLLLCESVILGREAMGESVAEGLLEERWRVRLAGRLVFADNLRLHGDLAGQTARAAGLAGHRAFATVLATGSGCDLSALRALLGPSGGASRLEEGLLVARLVAPSGIELRRRLVPALALLENGPLPRLWSL